MSMMHSVWKIGFTANFQRFGLQVSYKFNATKSKYKGTGAGQSEKNRL